MILSRVADIQIRLGLMMESEATMLEMHDTMKPLEEEYQQQALLSEMLRRHESFKALNGKESSADPKLVAAVRRILGTWPSMSSDDWPDFSVSRGELLEDIEGLELEQGKQAFCQLLSLCDTLYFKRISLAESTSVEQVAAARSNALYRFARHWRRREPIQSTTSCTPISSNCGKRPSILRRLDRSNSMVKVFPLAAGIGVTELVAACVGVSGFD